jgi:hypothetical protein
VEARPLAVLDEAMIETIEELRLKRIGYHRLTAALDPAGVVLHLKGTQEGMTLSLGREEILIEML